MTCQVDSSIGFPKQGRTWSVIKFSRQWVWLVSCTSICVIVSVSGVILGVNEKYFQTDPTTVGNSSTQTTPCWCQKGLDTSPTPMEVTVLPARCLLFAPPLRRLPPSTNKAEETQRVKHAVSWRSTIFFLFLLLIDYAGGTRPSTEICNEK